MGKGMRQHPIETRMRSPAYRFDAILKESDLQASFRARQ
jgi:hypothetical protein